eukprot:TRINITY_DN8032_c0_g1_i3.p1 TRINITY_DN8032_c0_g1~~TRINITY_DN8032_c0_g1_i3.p1  ORF type:complete len:136 (+),score=18.95 TRINITY_DN8032_c0_g1_i3:215-622(+)
MTNAHNDFPNPARPQKKRAQYKWLTDQQKCDLVFCSIYLDENIKEVCEDLGINFLTGRNIVQKYKKTGFYSTQYVLLPEPLELDNARMITGDTNKKRSECPLGIIILDEFQMKIVAFKSYTRKEELNLLRLHTVF